MQHDISCFKATDKPSSVVSDCEFGRLRGKATLLNHVAVVCKLGFSFGQAGFDGPMSEICFYLFAQTRT